MIEPTTLKKPSDAKAGFRVGQRTQIRSRPVRLASRNECAVLPTDQLFMLVVNPEIRLPARTRQDGYPTATAMHWTPIGAMYAKKEKLQHAYIELVELLIFHGANINAEDDFGSTLQDYQDASPNAQFAQMLLENGASNASGQDENAGVSS